MTAAMPDDLPRWAAVRDTVIPHNRICTAGTIIRAHERPGCDFVRLLADANSRAEVAERGARKLADAIAGMGAA